MSTYDLLVCDVRCLLGVVSALLASTARTDHESEEEDRVASMARGGSCSFDGIRLDSSVRRGPLPAANLVAEGPDFDTSEKS